MGRRTSERIARLTEAIRPTEATPAAAPSATAERSRTPLEYSELGRGISPSSSWSWSIVESDPNGRLVRGRFEPWESPPGDEFRFVGPGERLISIAGLDTLAKEQALSGEDEHEASGCYDEYHRVPLELEP